jgi:hypothetical protein
MSMLVLASSSRVKVMFAQDYFEDGEDVERYDQNIFAVPYLITRSTPSIKPLCSTVRQVRVENVRYNRGLHVELVRMIRNARSLVETHVPCLETVGP